MATGNMESSEQARPPHCPRCASTNTKFCYYNNYSFSQPRYLCKACRRYWTKGGSLRNVPAAGPCRRRRRARPQPRPPYSFSSSSEAQIDLAAVFANYVSPGSSLKAHPPAHHHSLFNAHNELCCSSPEFLSWEPVAEPAALIAEDRFFQSDSMSQVMSDIDWSCFDLGGYAASFGN